MIEKVQESHLYMWLKEKDSKFLSKLDETIEYANTILPQINNVFADRKSTRLNSSHRSQSRMPSSA